MSEAIIVKDLKSKQFSPAYALVGEEPYFIEELERLFIEKALDEADKDFNQHVLYGKDTDAEEVVKLAQQFPMMADRQLILVKEAQNLGKLDAFEKYLKKPQPQTVLVLSFKGKKNDKTIPKVFSKGVVFESKRIYDNQLPAFVSQQVQKRGLKIEDKALIMMCDYLGADLAKIVNEIEKLVIKIEAGGMITGDVVAENIGFSKEFNFYSLNGAMARRDKTESLKTAFYMAQNTKTNPLVLILGQLYNLYSKALTVQFLGTSNPGALASALKVSPYAVKEFQTAAVKYSRRELAENIHLLAKYDLKSKGLGNSSTEDGSLLIELVPQLLRG